MSFGFGSVRRGLLGAAFAAVLAGAALVPHAAHAWWVGVGVPGVVVTLPRVYVAPPVVVAPAPPVVYAAPGPRWVPGHYWRGYWVHGHWA